ncbi:helix-turn-helix transcriptional regulator [Brevibacillus nitrificans]|uniref:helix-turn-helix transcriptional regulator n=1 Tax=Brevibacillus nitrificans TaxID=651560 RepID=UPI0028652F2E|nr:helix-turn-helix transcriptional regulator [Brevibacillus nitrificans]MDR7318877.1 transcriptional regulator with XRE-family HTH domain [Brevibacillus nitrificans]
MAFKVGRCLLLQHLTNSELTQQELADRVGMTKQQVNNYAHNRGVMTLENAINIASVLGCPVEKLYELEVVSVDALKKGRSSRRE